MNGSAVNNAVIARFAIGVALFCGSATNSFAQATASTLVGVWAVTSTPRSCATTAPLGPPSRSLVTYHQDGTVVESIGLVLFAPDQRTIGHGVWTHAGGSTYSERTATMIVFDTPPNTPPGSPGFPAGWVVAGITNTLTDADHFTSTSTVNFYDINRQPNRPPTCATRVGERFK